MAELADAADSKSADLRVLGVQLPLPAPTSKGFDLIQLPEFWAEQCPHAKSSVAGPLYSEMC
jgi:hypothetical protein